MRGKKFISLFIILLFFKSLGSAQEANEVKIDYSKNKIALNEFFTITLTMPNEKKKEIGNFPEITDLVKKKTFFKKEDKKFLVTQQYLPRKAGNFYLPSFTIYVNGKNIKGNSIEIQVEKRKIPSEKPEKEPKYESIKPDIFLEVSASKNKLYITEQECVTAFLYISKENKAEINYIDLQAQISKIRQRLKPQNVWMSYEDTASSLLSDTVSIHNKSYNRILLYKSFFHPIELENIELNLIDLSQDMFRIKETLYLCRFLQWKVL